MAEVYNHKLVEKKWQGIWDEEKAFEVITNVGHVRLRIGHLLLRIEELGHEG